LKLKDKFYREFTVDWAWKVFIRGIQCFTLFVIFILIEMLNVFIPDYSIAWLYVLEIYTISWLIVLLFLQSLIPKCFFYIKLIYFYILLYVIAFIAPAHYFDIYATGAEANLYDALYWSLRLAYLILCTFIFFSIMTWRVSFKPVVVPFIKKSFIGMRLLRWQ
jgi:hypothetical protein